MPEDQFWVEYTIGAGGYSEFWKIIDGLKPKPLKLEPEL